MKYTAAKIRQEVAQRANFRCEHCHIHQDDMFLAFEIDHIIAQKHGAVEEMKWIILRLVVCIAINTKGVIW